MSKEITWFDPLDRDETTCESKKKSFLLPSTKPLSDENRYLLVAATYFQLVVRAKNRREVKRYCVTGIIPPFKEPPTKNPIVKLFRAKRKQAYKEVYPDYKRMFEKLEEIEEAGDVKAKRADLSSMLFQLENLMAALVGKRRELLDDPIIRSYWMVSHIRNNQGFFERMGKALQRWQGLHQNNDQLKALAIATLLDQGVGIGSISVDGDPLTDDAVRKLFKRHNIHRDQDPNDWNSEQVPKKLPRQSLKPKSRGAVLAERKEREAVERDFGERLK